MNQIIMILLISLLVLVHELGHFFAAKLCKIRVTRFGIGMPIGPSFKLFKWNHTTFYIHAFLFGGYVSFADDEEAFRKEKSEDKDNIDEDEILPKDSNELYENKTIPQKLFVVSAGVVMNVVFALFLVMSCAMYYHKLPGSCQNIFVDSFADNITSNIQSRGIIKGDKFSKINNHKISNLYELTFFSRNSKLFDDFSDKDLYEENIVELKKLNPELKLDLNSTIKKGTKIILPKPKPEKALEVNDDVLKGLEKYSKKGIELNENQIELRNLIYNKNSCELDFDVNFKDLALALSDTYKPLNIAFIRNNKEYTLTDIIVQKEGILGVMLKVEDVYIETKTFKDVVLKSCDYLYTTTKTMLYGLYQLITGKVSANDMHGVIAIVKVGGDIIASKGLINGILLTAMISVNLAIMNFLPIPALDGGHVMFLIIEKLTGVKPTKEFAEKINNFFFILLIVLMIAICYNDIFALITKKF